MARITAQNYQSYMKGANNHIATHQKEMYLGDSPTVQAGYGTYDSTETAHKVACYMFSLDDSATATTPCTDIPRGFTVAVETDNSVIEYQYKKPMPVAGYTASDLEVKGISNVDASDVTYKSSNVETALGNAEDDIQQLRSDIGTMSSLETDSNRNLVGAVNEVNTKANSANTKIGTLTSLHTTNKATVVDAINEVKTTATDAATAASSSALAAQSSASTASGYYSDILTAMGNLGSGEAVAAQVAINQADIAELKLDIVVDLSTRYSTSYANLSAALTVLNNDTATDATAIKKAGVSIKFINSSTNKYEQWNLKASSWSTNISDWALDVDGNVINGKLKLPFEIEKPSPDTYVTQASQIGMNSKPLDRAVPSNQNIPQGDSADFEITDENGYVIVKFQGGHLILKNFNSAEVITTINNVITTLNNKVDKILGKGLSTNDYTTAEKTKLANLGNSDIIVRYTNEADLDIADESGNVILRLSDGEIKVKNFDSRTGGGGSSCDVEVIDGKNILVFN